MIFQLLTIVAVLSSSAHALKTVYEAETKSPQNADYDAVNNRFAAHQGWLNDKLIHYYKFRMHTPSTYPGLFAAKSDLVPLNKLYILSTSAALADAVPNQKPLLWKHHADGEEYSDFVEVIVVTVPGDYAAGTFTGTGDVTDEPQTSIGWANLPVVPNNAKLQDPADYSADAPIAITPVHYQGTEVHTFVFEVSTAELAAFWAATRTVDASDFAYAIPVVPDLVAGGAVSRIPLWHFNQYWEGVTTGENNGGPNPNGQRNVINLDRGDAGYSPLWTIEWVTRVPVNYNVDEASNANMINGGNGFAIASTPMLVNCPDIGVVGAVNANKRDAFAAADAKLPLDGTVHLQGALVMQADHKISARVDGTEIDSTQTNGMGGFSFSWPATDVPGSDSGAATVELFHVVDETTEKSIAEYELKFAAAGEPSSTSAAPSDIDITSITGQDNAQTITLSVSVLIAIFAFIF